MPLEELVVEPREALDRVLYELGYTTPREREMAVSSDSSREWRWGVEIDAVVQRVEPWRVYASIRRWKTHKFAVPPSPPPQSPPPSPPLPPLPASPVTVTLDAEGPAERWSNKADGLHYAKVAVDELFPFLPEHSAFDGHRLAQLFVTTATAEQRQFVGLFAKTARVYATTLLRLPFRSPSPTRDGGTAYYHRTVDFRTADARVLAAALKRSDGAGQRGGGGGGGGGGRRERHSPRDPDTLFYAMVACRAELGSDADGTHLYLPLVPAPPDASRVQIDLTPGDVDVVGGGRQGRKVAAVASRPDPGRENWQLTFAMWARVEVKGGGGGGSGGGGGGGGGGDGGRRLRPRRRRHCNGRRTKRSHAVPVAAEGARPGSLSPPLLPPSSSSLAAATAVAAARWEMELAQIVLDFATLDFWTRPPRMRPLEISKLMRGVFPVAYAQNLERTSYLRKVYGWRMRWRYADAPLVYCQGKERGAVTALTVPPWH